MAHYKGPIKRKNAKAIQGSFCIQVVGHNADVPVLCLNPTVNGEWWCAACKDPEGYTTRLASQMEQAKQQLQQAYPAQPWTQPFLFEDDMMP